MPAITAERVAPADIARPAFLLTDLYLAGQWRKTDDLLDVLDPSDGSVVGRVSVATEAHAIEALEAARRYTRNPMDEQQRASVLTQWADRIDMHRERLSRLLTRENGKCITNSRVEVQRAAITARCYADAALTLNRAAFDQIAALSSMALEDRRSLQTGEGHVPVTIHRPLGVVTAYTPFNFPANTVVHKIACAIAAGNAIVLKPSEKTPLTAIELARLFADCGAPGTVLSVLTGHHQTLTRPLVTHEAVDFFSMTGHSLVGRLLHQQFTAAHPFKHCHFELGGNGPQLVLEDFDPKSAASMLTTAVYDHSGSRCTTPRKILVPASRAWMTPFLKAAVEHTRDWRYGDPMDDSIRMGALIDDEAAITVQARVDEAVKDGAQCLTGGQRRGAFFDPTVLVGVTPEMRIFTEENFGPVLSILPYESIDGAIRIANIGDYGLQPAVMTNDPAMGWECARQLRGGCINIGHAATSHRSDTVPFGGVGSSGVGKEGGLGGVIEMCESTPYKFYAG